MKKSLKDKFQNIVLGKKLLFVGIGNALKSDDAVGIYICRKLKQTEKFKVLIVESGIEKFVGKINSIEHDILVLIDSTDFNEKPGFFDILTIDKIQDLTANTHTISVKRISEFFEKKTYLLGIQPENVNFGEELSYSVKTAADEVIKIIKQ